MEPGDQPVYEADVGSFGVLLGVVAAAFVALGAIIYFFGEEQSAVTANNPPAQTERSTKARPAPPAEPSTVGQSSGQ